MAKPLVARKFHGRSILEPKAKESRIAEHRFNARKVKQHYIEKRANVKHTQRGEIVGRVRVESEDPSKKYQIRKIVAYRYKVPKHEFGGYSIRDKTIGRVNKVGLTEFGVAIPKKLYSKVDNLLYVDVAPMWRYAKIRIRKNSAYDRTTKQMRNIRRTVYEDMFYGVRKRNRKYLSVVFPKRNFNIAIRVGFIHPDSYHGSWTGRNIISYRSLVAGLMLRGFDPLLPLRDKKYLASVAREMGRACGEAIEKGRSFESVLRKYGRDMEDYVYQYILGGIKPPLADSTIEKRESLKRHGVYRYPRGISEPLVETGEMANEVSYEFVTIKQEESPEVEDDSEEEEKPKQESPKQGMTQWDLISRMAEMQAQVESANRGLFGRERP